MKPSGSIVRTFYSLSLPPPFNLFNDSRIPGGLELTLANDEAQILTLAKTDFRTSIHWK
jgi:hypothetical protein